MNNKKIKQKDTIRANEEGNRISIFSQPSLVIEINREIRKPERDFSKINRLVSKDVALSAKVMKLVNASFFDLEGPVDSIYHAIDLATKSNYFKSMVTASLREALGGEELGMHRAIYEEFWSHSELVAAMSELIAKQVGVVGLTSLDQPYMVGLFHDCGVPIMLNRSPDYMDMVNTALNGEASSISIENDRYNTDHCVVGYQSAKSWNLPDPVCQAVRAHHDPDIQNIKDASVRTLAAIVMMAEHVTLAYGSVEYDTTETEEHWVNSHKEVMDELDLNLSDLQDLKEDAFELLA
ncbi:MAG: HDOD domain-containing protein [Nitrospiria bacterium]